MPTRAIHAAVSDCLSPDGRVLVNYDALNGVTEVTAIPELATLLLLGLGGLALVRRRRA